MKTDAKLRSDTPALDSNHSVPRLVWLMILFAALLIPAKIISYGYTPEDDALRHAAKAVSGKPWSEIVVISDNYTVDHSFGWHVLLRQIHLRTGWTAEQLVDLEVFALFALLGCCALPWLKRPEAWLGALLIGVVGWPTLASRFMIGRPLLLTVIFLVTVLLLWHRRSSLRPDWRTAGIFSVLIGVAVWFHGVWYLWALPVAAFFLARQFRWGITLAVGWIIGTLAAATLTGHPVNFILEAVQMAIRATTLHSTARTLVSEFQPISGGLLLFLVLGGILITRQLAKLDARTLTANPAFWMACMGWVLGFVGRRFWDDWGLPALLVLAACELDLLLQARLAADSVKRLALTGCLAVATVMACSSDIDSRWTRGLSRQYLTQDNPDLAGWLPDRGGIFYAADPSFFYETFLKNPTAEWRYLLSFEMTLMPEDDFNTLYRILWNYGAAAAYEPWVEKMRPEDRLFVRAEIGSQPPIPGLEWHYTLGGMWSGRLARASSPAAAP